MNILQSLSVPFIIKPTDIISAPIWVADDFKPSYSYPINNRRGFAAGHRRQAKKRRKAK